MVSYPFSIQDILTLKCYAFVYLKFRVNYHPGILFSCLGFVCCCDDPSLRAFSTSISQVSLGREGMPAEDSDFCPGPLGK